MALSDAQINRIKIREWWNFAQGPGGPWGQQEVIAGKSVDLGQFYEYVAAADPEHGLENVYIDIQANHGGDVRLHSQIEAENLVRFFLSADSQNITAIKTKLGA
jgi:hypothetical protein